MENKYIYILEGSRGCYDDYCSWIVDAYTTEEKASEIRDELNKAPETIKEANKVFEEYNESEMYDVPHYKVIEVILRE